MFVIGFIVLMIYCLISGVIEDLNGKEFSEWGSQATESGVMVVLVYVDPWTWPILFGEFLLDDGFLLRMVPCFTLGCLWECDLGLLRCNFLFCWVFWLWSGFLFNNNGWLSFSLCLVCLCIFFCCGFFLPCCLFGFRGSLCGTSFLTDFLGLNNSCILIDGCLLFSL